MGRADVTGAGGGRELYEALLDAVRRFCLDHGAALVGAGTPVRVVVTTGADLVIDADQQDDFVDAVEHVARHNLPGIVEVRLQFLPGRDLAPDGFRIGFPGRPEPEPSTGPPTQPVNGPPTAPADGPRRAVRPDETTQPLADPRPSASGTRPTPSGAWPSASGTWPTPDARSWSESGGPLPPVPDFADGGAAPLPSSTQRVIRFTYDTGRPVTQPTWLFTLRPAPEWVPLGRDLQVSGDQPGLELSTLGAIPRGRMLFLCVRERSVHLLRTPLRADYQVALGDLPLSHRQIVVLPPAGTLKWTHRSMPGTSVVRYELRERVIR